MPVVRLLAFLLSAAAAIAQESSSLQLSSASASGGATVNLSLSLTPSATDPPVAMEWDLVAPSAVVSTSTTLSAQATSAGKSITCLFNRCILWGINDNAIPAGAVADVAVTLAPGASGTVIINFNDVLAADAEANPAPILAQSGSIEVSSGVPSISVVSSATGSAPFAAGQLVSIYGSQLGPSTGSVAQIGPNGAVTNMNAGTQVLFDGVAAPLLFTSANQVNTAIPCSVAGQASTQVVVDYQGTQSAPATLALGPAAPGIFTDDGSGSGQGAVLNQDYSLNGPQNPAARGSIAILYATGIGLTSPCQDGQIYQSNFPKPTLKVIVGVGNIGAQVQYAGQAPDLVSGVAQVNFVIPSNATTGAAVPLTLEVGGIFSPSGVTIAVK